MKISIVCVGKIKEKFYVDAIREYVKRLGKYCDLKIIEVKDEKAPENMSEAMEEQVKEKEGDRILKSLRDDMHVIALAIDGKQLSSEELAEKIDRSGINGISHIAFIIGGSLGLSDAVLNRADFKLSFSKMTFPHQLMRVVLLEQVYRGFRIIRGEPYHK